MTEPDRFVTIPHFVTHMLGMKHRAWYYRHKADPGMPQPVTVGGSPRLSYQACVDYIEGLKAARVTRPKRRRRR